MKFLKILCISILALLCLCSCNDKKASAKELSGLLKNYGNVEFSMSEESDLYNFDNDIFTVMDENSLHATSQAIVKGKVTGVDELKVNIQYPMERIIPAEESATGSEEVITEYIPVEAYIRLLTFKPSEVFYDATGKVGEDEFRIMTRISSKMWDDRAIPLSEGDEAILYLSSAEAENDIMKIYDRGFASFVLYDSSSCVIKKTDKGWLFGKSHKFMSEAAKEYTEVFGLTSDNAADLYSKDKLAKCYKDAASYYSSLSSLFVIDNPDGAVKNNVRYYYE